MNAIVQVLTSKIEAGTWIVRSFTPLQKDESLTEVDARAARVIGYHKLQDEKRVGARLDQPQALAIARSSFPRFGANVNQFDLKEALAFQQPNRRDWLFHFQERSPLVGEAYRRISVRLQGSQVTQFTTTIKIPEQAYRDAEQTNFLNVTLWLLYIIGLIAVLSLTVAGFVMAARKHFPWRRPARLTAMLAIIPVGIAIVRFRASLFTYPTSISWETFVNSQVISAFVVSGFLIGLLFLALAGIEASYPQALDRVRREGRARFGRSALVAALTAFGAVTIVRIALQWLVRMFPAVAPPGGVDLSPWLNMSDPSLLAIGEALGIAIVLSGFVALFVTGVRGMPRADRYGDAVAVVAIFLVFLNPGTRGREAPLMLLSAAVFAGLAWFLVRYVLRDNLLAYPVAAAMVMLLTSAASMLQNHRSDLTVNAVIVIVAAVVLAGWIALPPRAEYA